MEKADVVVGHFLLGLIFSFIHQCSPTGSFIDGQGSTRWCCEYWTKMKKKGNRWIHFTDVQPSFHQDYVYALLTGYVDPPPGVNVAEGMNYNPCVRLSPRCTLSKPSLLNVLYPPPLPCRYFPGGGIAMARVLYDGLVEYDDGT